MLRITTLLRLPDLLLGLAYSEREFRLKVVIEGRGMLRPFQGLRESLMGVGGLKFWDLTWGKKESIER